MPRNKGVNLKRNRGGTLKRNQGVIMSGYSTMLIIILKQFRNVKSTVMNNVTSNQCDIQLVSDEELLTILLSQELPYDTITSNEANELLQLCDNSLQRLITLRPNLQEVSPVMDNAIVKINAAMELAKRCMVSARDQVKISKSADVFEQFKELTLSLYEEFWILGLNRANRMIFKKRISEGGITGTVVDIRKIFHYAISNLATSLILVHNHPSGNLSPSEADITLTTKLANAGKMLDIEVLDHIIIGNDEYYSFADNGKL